ncbi:MAG: hypothetical protein RR161_04040 [Bacilli bacterium]
MKIKKTKERYEKKVNKKPIKNKQMIDYFWILTVTILAFVISGVFSILSDLIVPNVNVLISIIIVFLFILIGVVFDMIGISVAVADKKTFNSMASKKIKGANTAIKLIKNAEKVSSFCNDVIGDICGIISGSTGLAICYILNKQGHINLLFITLLVTSLIAAFTIGGKAIGKTYAINKSNIILYKFAKTISWFY